MGNNSEFTHAGWCSTQRYPNPKDICDCGAEQKVKELLYKQDALKQAKLEGIRLGLQAALREANGEHSHERISVLDPATILAASESITSRDRSQDEYGNSLDVDPMDDPADE